MRLFYPPPSSQPRHDGKRGFSLIELSIVLVILGLLAGGVMAGQSLVRTAQARSVITEAERYTAALYAFRGKYNAIPGDFRDATRFWGRQSGDALCVSHTSEAENSDGACDGDGDRQIAWSDTAYPTEAMQSWRHLALAGLVAGSYSGMKTVPFSEPGINTPASKLPQARWVFYYMKAQGVGTANNYGGILWANQFTLSGADGISPVLTPEEAWNIDTKLDDGKPGRGRINTLLRTACDTSATPLDYDGQYDFAVKDRACALRWGRVI